MFSVVVPAYNHAEFLPQAIVSALWSPLVTEVLILDDGSRDRSAAVAARLAATSGGRVRDLTPKGGGNRGAHYRLNELVEAAKCEWVAVLNSDDVFVRGRFERMVANPGFSRSEFVFGHLLFINKRGTLIGAKLGPASPGVPFPAAFQPQRMVAEGNLLDLLAHQNFVATTSNMVFRKSLHSRVGGFAAYRYVHDWDFALRAIILGEALYVQNFLTAYRFHSGNTISVSQKKVDIEAAALFARLLSHYPTLLDRRGFALALQPNANGVFVQRDQL